MKVIRVERNGGPDVLVPADAPVPQPQPDEILIRQTVIGVNYIDVYVRNGAYKRDLPLVPGREGVGVVEAVGADVAGFRPGMRVAYCESPKLGGYAEYVAVPARFAYEVPDAVDDRIACAATLQGLTAHYLVTDSHPVARGETVLIHAAAGGVGRLFVQMAKRRGATVIATAGGAAKLELARSAGADHVIDYRAEDFEPAVKRILGGGACDAVYDSVGKDTWERSLRCVRVRGSFVLFGASSGPVPPIDPQTLSAAGSVFFSRPTLTHFVRTHGELAERAGEVMEAIADGSLDVRVSNVYPLADAKQAHLDLESRKTTGKSLLLV